MPTTYRVCGSAIEKVGPASDQVRPIAFCRRSQHGRDLWEALEALHMAYRIGELDNRSQIAARIVLTRAGLI